MKNPPVAKKSDPDSWAFPVSNLSSQFPKERDDIRPLDIGRDRVGKDRFESFGMFSLHRLLVLQFGTIVKQYGQHLHSDLNFIIHNSPFILGSYTLDAAVYPGVCL